MGGSQPSSGLALESSSGLQDVTGPDNGVRESETEQGFSEDLEDLGAVAPPVSGDLTKEVSGNVEGWWEGSGWGVGWAGPERVWFLY